MFSLEAVFSKLLIIFTVFFLILFKFYICGWVFLYVAIQIQAQADEILLIQSKSVHLL